MTTRFEWDRKKSEINHRKHGISFDEAQTVFTDVFSIAIPDTEHSQDEERSIIVGRSNKNRLLVVAYSERGNNIRLISARKTTRTERRKYEEEYFS
jgi:uncharacterized protein